MQQGLKVPGYRPQSDEAVAAVTAFKNFEELVLRTIDAAQADPALAVDGRWLAIGRTSIEQGFMAVNRAIFKPARISDEQLSVQGEQAGT